jgi:hypothetical protein
MVVIKNNAFTHNFLKIFGKSGEFKSESCCRDEFCHIGVDNLVFRLLMETDHDID